MDIYGRDLWLDYPYTGWAVHATRVGGVALWGHLRNWSIFSIKTYYKVNIHN